ncbi:LLM class flavin-dependent oxidoreductase [Patulibacter americanus]|uniref:LLM class flavin-dependent oxidoreductase n=1 Tax=Patulibacter americanus TaxID=588672 RepID=UPI0003B556DD|nr:LLM class flavin-dependent oxidoreductase [Patulibacter americanus]
MRVGAFIVPDAADPATTVRQIEAAEGAGLDLVGIQDHPYQPRFLETWTLLAFAAARTRSIQLVSGVANLPLRPPAMLAKAAASLELLSEGRFALGLGSGAFGDAVAAMGGPKRTAPEGVDALEEAIAIIQGWWRGDRPLTVDGTHYRVKGAHPGPPPSQKIPLWLGAYKPRMLGLTGRLADGWLPTIPYIDLAADAQRSHHAIDEAAKRAGREPGDVERALIAPLDGPPPTWPDQLVRLHETHRFGTALVTVPAGTEGLDQLARLGEQAAVARERTPAGS